MTIQEPVLGFLRFPLSDWTSNVRKGDESLGTSPDSARLGGILYLAGLFTSLHIHLS